MIFFPLLLLLYTQQADDFLDAMPDMLQERQTSAVEHAIRGDYRELEKVRQSRNSQPEYPATITVADFTITADDDTIPVRLYRPVEPKQQPLPLMVYYHGGGWTFGSLNSCAAYCSAVADTGEAMVMAVDYPLAPEHPYPEPLDACVKGAEYAFAHAEEWGSAPTMVTLAGDSSGANLALATAMRLADASANNNTPNSSANNEQRTAKNVLLFYPVLTTADGTGGSWHKYRRGYGLDAQLMSAFNRAYGGTADDPYASPMAASDQQLRRLPPVTIVSAERDILADQAQAFAERLEGLDHQVRHAVYPGAVHLFITVAGQPAAFQEAVREGVEVVRL